MTVSAYAIDGHPSVVRSVVQLSELEKGQTRTCETGRHWRNLTLILKLHMEIYVEKIRSVFNLLCNNMTAVRNFPFLSLWWQELMTKCPVHWSAEVKCNKLIHYEV